MQRVGGRPTENSPPVFRRPLRIVRYGNMKRHDISISLLAYDMITSVLWQTVGQIKMKIRMHVGLGPSHIVLDWDPAPPCKKGAQPPNFRPMSLVAKWLDRSRCHLVGRYTSAQATLCLMGTQLPPKGHILQFLAHVCCGQTAGWIEMPFGTEVDLGRGHIVLDVDPAPLPKKVGHSSSIPSFSPMSIVAKRSPISATAEHLSVLVLLL